MSGKLEKWKQRARELKTEVHALYLAVWDPRVPWYAKLIAVSVVAYALSPIDLIPDFIPVVGYLDDLILVPLGITLTIKMIPPDVLSECRAKARARTVEGKTLAWIGASVIIAAWILAAILVATYLGTLLFKVSHYPAGEYSAKLVYTTDWRYRVAPEQVHGQES
jgi:uncharacterized membrane protein YkvA (DUF1232 family)